MDTKLLMKIGAKTRLVELDRERADLLKMLGEKNGAVKRRSHLSAAAKKQISLRMKAYWAERHKDTKQKKASK